MSSEQNAYLVVRREDGFGDVYPLSAGQRYTLGRAPACQIVLKDDLCSREHAEVYHASGGWRLRDLNSRNGTRLNNQRVDAEVDLAPTDMVSVGKSQLMFVEAMEQLPHVPRPRAGDGEDVSIKKRLGQTSMISVAPGEEGLTAQMEKTSSPANRHSLRRALSQLYRMGLEMASAESYEGLVRIVLDGLLEAIPAEVGAVLTIRPNRELEVTAHRHRDPSLHDYVRVSDFVSNEVLASREAVLAEDKAREQHLRNRENVAAMRPSSVICAPVMSGDKILGLIHLYCTDPHRSLDAEDLEFAVAVAKQLGTCSQRVRRHDQISRQNDVLRQQLRLESELVGDSPPMRYLAEQIKRVAPTHATVLIRGESGAGKELIARAIHYSSQRRDGPFITLNCAALTETLLESELFGHEKGAFTGATEKKIGKFEAADKGTIFLDEIGEMSPSTQAKFLRVLEGHSFERVGGHTSIRADVRVLSATNTPLEQAVHEGKFRRDLFFRLQVVEIHAPPLRDRKDDIPLLAEHFLRRFVVDVGRRVKGFTAAALEKMQEYHWPGNVRELRNVVERAVALGTGSMVDSQDILLSALDDKVTTSSGVLLSFKTMTLEELERRHIVEVLVYTDWNKTQAASLLGIERSTLDRKIRAYELRRAD